MLSRRAQSLKPSPTLALAAKAKELESQGHDVISLSVGEPDWDSFQVAKKAAIEAINEGFTKYTPAPGIPALKEAICQQTNRELGSDYSPAQVTTSTGGKFIIFSGLQTLLDPGDEVIIPAPYWVSYPTMVELADGVPVIVSTQKENDFKMTGKELAASITSKTKLLILNSPSNPTGGMYSKAELNELAQVLIKNKHVYIMSDDIYNRLVFNEAALAPHLLQVAPELSSRVLVVNGAAKVFSMTGWRVGWALGPKTWIDAMNNYQSQSVSCACSISQKATLAAIKEGQPELEKALVLLKERRDYIYQEMKKLPGVHVTEPQGAFYIWPDFSEHLGKTYQGKKMINSSDLAAALLEDQMVAAVPGNEFGVDGYMRISYALDKKRMTEAVSRIRNFLEKLKN